MLNSNILYKWQDVAQIWFIIIIIIIKVAEIKVMLSQLCSTNYINDM